jgi:Hint domain
MLWFRNARRLTDGILIPASNLVNGVTIVADAKPEALSLTYFHIELNTHEAILAEGPAVESFRPRCVRQCRRVCQIVRLARGAVGALCANRPLSQQPPRVGIAHPQRTRARLRFSQADRKGPRLHCRSLCPRCLIDRFMLAERLFSVCLNDKPWG